MIAVGTRVLFMDMGCCESHAEPHSGGTGEVVGNDDGNYTLTFPDGAVVWASSCEVTAL